MKLSANQIETVTTIVTKQRDSLLKFASEDGRACDAATILSTALVVLASDFYPSEDESEGEGEGEGKPTVNDYESEIVHDETGDPHDPALCSACEPPSPPEPNLANSTY